MTDQKKPIDNVTTTNLDLALRMCRISIPIDVVDKIIDLVELLEEKGDQVTLKDITELQIEWKKRIHTTGMA